LRPDSLDLFGAVVTTWTTSCVQPSTDAHLGFGKG